MITGDGSIQHTKEPTMNTDQLLTIDDVADRLRVHRSYVYKLIRLGELPQPIKLGKATRIRATELQAAVKAFSN